MRLLLLIAAAACAQAQQLQVGGLVSGALFDPPTRAIRSVIGLPGAARFGAQLVSDLDQAWPSPDANYAIAIRRGQLLALRIGVENPLLQDAAPGQLQVAWSPDSTTAVLTSADTDGSATFRIWQPSQAGMTSIRTAFPLAAIRGVAVRGTSDFLAAIQVPDQPGIYRFSSTGDVTLVQSVTRPEAVAWDPAEQLLYWLNGDDRTVSHVAADLGDLACPCWLALTGTQLAVAGSNSASVTVLDLTGVNPSVQLPIDVLPQGLFPYGAAGAFAAALRGTASGSAQIVDLKAGMAYFIPDGNP